MIGEKLGWFRVASHLGMPVFELRERITFTEFIDWIIYLDREEEWKTKCELYWAQIAAEVRRGLVETPSKVKVKDFIIQVGKPKPDISKSKQAWAGALGIKLK